MYFGLPQGPQFKHPQCYEEDLGDHNLCRGRHIDVALISESHDKNLQRRTGQSATEYSLLLQKPPTVIKKFRPPLNLVPKNRVDHSFQNCFDI